MLRIFESRTADEVWQKLKNAFIEKSSVVHQESRCGATKEILHAAFSIEEPRQRWVISREPAINPAFAIAEVVWILGGRRDSKFLNYFNRQLPKFAGEGANYHGAYGFRLRQHFGIDQIERAYNTLRQNPQSRQVVLQIWDGVRDLPNIEGKESDPDIPCNLVSMLKLRNGALEWTQIMRSNDLHLGLPHNIVQFTTLQEVIAGWLGVQIGSYNHMSDSLHVYESNYPSITGPVLAKALTNTDSLLFPKTTSDMSFSILERSCDTISNNKVSAHELKRLIEESTLPLPFRNMLCILCAEGARKRKCLDLGDEIMVNCSNLLYKQLWQRWVKRTLDFPHREENELASRS